MSGATTLFGMQRRNSAATLSAAWSSLAALFGISNPVANEDRAINWSGPDRIITTNYGGAGDLEYRKASGSWTAYASFSLTAGQTVAWRYTGVTDDSGSFDVYVDGEWLASVPYSAVGFP